MGENGKEERKKKRQGPCFGVYVCVCVFSVEVGRIEAAGKKEQVLGMVWVWVYRWVSCKGNG